MKVLDLLLLSGEFIENKEGTVITFANGKMAKQKNYHYLTLHGLLSDGLKENKLVQKILDEEIDDVLAFLPVDAIEEREFINDLTDVVVSHVNHIANEAYNKFQENFDGDRKTFAMKYKKDPLFYFMAKLFNENTVEYVEKFVIEKVKHNCFRLEKAKTYLQNLGFKRELKLLEDSD